MAQRHQKTLTTETSTSRDDWPAQLWWAGLEMAAMTTACELKTEAPIAALGQPSVEWCLDGYSEEHSGSTVADYHWSLNTWQPNSGERLQVLPAPVDAPPANPGTTGLLTFAQRGSSSHGWHRWQQGAKEDTQACRSLCPWGRRTRPPTRREDSTGPSEALSWLQTPQREEHRGDNEKRKRGRHSPEQ